MVSSTLPWQDRFATPTAAQLRSPLKDDVGTLFDRLRQDLSKRPGVQESVVWYGLNWCWSLEYRSLPAKPSRGAADEQPLAVLVPSPTDLQLAMPVDQEFIQLLPVRRLKRSVRDGLELASEPFDTRWAVWSVVPPLIDDLRDLLDRRVRHLAIRVQPRTA